MTGRNAFHLRAFDLRAPVFSGTETQAATSKSAKDYYDDIVAHEG